MSVLLSGSSVLAADFVAPKIDYAAIMPMLIVVGAAFVAVLVEAFGTRSFRAKAQPVLSVVTLLAALGAVMWESIHDTNEITAGAGGGHGSVAIDGPALFLQGTLLVFGLLALLTMSDTTVDGGAFTPQASAVPGSVAESIAARAGLRQTEVFPLMLFSIAGMMLFVASNDLMTMFVALEVFSLPLYLMCGMARRRRLLSQEASLKYFLLGAFSSGFFLFGIAMIYAFAGSIYLGDIAAAISGQNAVAGMDALMLLGVALMAMGLLFKVGAVPFHAWTPDVYQGAPTPVTGFMAAATKVAAFGAMLRLFYVGLAGDRWDWMPVIGVIAAMTMIVGSVVAIVQTDVKRMLAYSSIAHAGFLLTGVLAMDQVGVSGVLFYLAAYGFTTIGAFALVSLVRDSGADGVTGEATHLSQWAGLGKRHPVAAGVFTLFLLAFAGIPLTSGFMGKYAVFSAAVAHGSTTLVVIGVLASAIAAFFYVRVIVLMYFSEPTAGAGAVANPGIGTLITILAAVVATLVFGIAPTALFRAVEASSLFVR